MKTYIIAIEDYVSEFYEKVAQAVDLSTSEVLSDSLTKTASLLSEAVLEKKKEGEKLFSKDGNLKS